MILILLFVTKAFIPAWRHLNSDFPNSYLAARLFREGYPIEKDYEWAWFQRQKDHRGIDQQLVGFIPQTPPSALVLLPWCALPPLQAKQRWLLVNLGFLMLIAVLLTVITKLGLQRVALLMFMAVIPLRDSFLLGQMHIFVLLLLTMGTWLYFKNRFFLSGVPLAIAAALKIYPVLFLVFFLIKKQWRAACGLLAGIGASALLSLCLFGMDACRFYAREVLPWAIRGQTVDPYDVTWGSLSALLARLFIAEPELNPAPIAHLPWLYALLYPFAVAFIFASFMWAIGFKTEDLKRQKLEWASYAFLLLLLSSQPASYHFVSLILPVVLVANYLLERGRRIGTAVLIGVYVLCCGSYDRLVPATPTGWQSLLCFPRLFFMVLSGGLLLWLLVASSGESANHRLRSRASMVPAFAFVALFGIGFTGNLRHFRRQFDNYTSRLVIVPGSAFAADPVVVPGHVFFTALAPRFLPSIPDTYTVDELKGDSLTSFAVGGDWFHPAVEWAGDSAWAEVATRSGSRTVRFSPATSISFKAGMAVEVEDAEQPVVSSDGTLLAFIREIGTRDSLWIRQTGSGKSESRTVEERKIAGPEYDVREAAFFPAHRMVFSSRKDGRFRLYAVDIASGVVDEMKAPSCSARYPAVSPDGQWMAFSCEKAGIWQLCAMDLHAAEPLQLQLTNSDCNSISPAWMPNSKDLVYATDCGRGLGVTALSKLSVPR